MTGFLQPRLNVQMGFEYERYQQHNTLMKGTAQKDTRLTSRLPPGYVAPIEGPGYSPEIKSPIMGLRKHMTRLTDLRSRVDLTTISKEMNHGGIHVNINANTYVRRVHPRVNQFVYTEWEFHKKYSGRREEHFNINCRTHDPDTSNTGYMGLLTSRKLVENNGHCETRDLGRGCYEFRMFGAQDYLLTVALQWTDALYQMASKVEHITLPTFNNYINSNPRKYADVTRWIAAVDADNYTGLAIVT